MCLLSDYSTVSLKGILIRRATIGELEDPDAPYVKKFIRVSGARIVC